MPDPYKQMTYLAQSLDPIHVGTGEFRLGRVDNTIVREAGTNLPKIPGSSLAGVARAYTAMKTNGCYPRCAGMGGRDGSEHCCQPNCPVCTTYGFSKPNLSFQGLAQFSDARILFFPVYSILGPQWITCPASLQDAGVTAAEVNWHDWNDRLTNGDSNYFFAFGRAGIPDWLNLGWLCLPRLPGANSAGTPACWQVRGTALPTSFPQVTPALERLVLVSNERFSNIVEDQLEIRTSVSISPSTGAAESGALFTAEAVPRATFFFFQVTYLDPVNFKVPPDRPILRNEVPATFADLAGNVKLGLDLAEYLGVGGVNTRGMGRLRIRTTEATNA